MSSPAGLATVFIKQALEEISLVKDKRNDATREACSEIIRTMSLKDEAKVFGALKSACGDPRLPTMPIALDCLGKLFLYKFWRTRENGQDWAHSVVDLVCNSFGGPDTDEKVQLQVVKALTNAITGADVYSAIHGSLLLSSVRTIYNVFVLSKSSNVQVIAQASLSQVVHTVFTRPISTSETPASSSPLPDREETIESDDFANFELSASLASIEHDNPFETLQGANKLNPQVEDPLPKSVQDQCLVDAYFIFRAICKLAIKPLPQDALGDLKSPAMRSKLLALHLVHSVLKSNMAIFLTPAPCLYNLSDPTAQPKFILAVKQFACLVFTRNILSPIAPVFDVSMEIFGRLLMSLRSYLKREIGVMFSQIIIPLVDAKTNSSTNQRLSLLRSLNRIFSDQENAGKLLVEIYLNYDCNVDAQDNIWERLVNALSRIMTSQMDTMSDRAPQSPDPNYGSKMSEAAPQISTSGMTAFSKGHLKEMSMGLDAFEVQRRGLDVLVKGILRSLVAWYVLRKKEKEQGLAKSEDEFGGIIDTPEERDDPTAFATAIQKKQRIIDGVKRFNFKPKTGIQWLIEMGCIADKTPASIAPFLLYTEGLNKTVIGEYLGEGDELNIAIMHAFVDLMDFKGKNFVSALREFLQSFRLPGEAQKIDRFVLKFAQRYLAGNTDSFSSADTGYVLSYSVIMLNTDQHNPQVKKKMTLNEFVKNNRGIDGGQDIQPEILEAIFNEIRENEIVLKDEREKLAQKQVRPALPSERRRVTKDAQSPMSAIIINKAESLMSFGRQMSVSDIPVSNVERFYVATHHEHLQPMFQLVWMPILLCISTALQRSSDLETTSLALEGFRLAGSLTSSLDLDFEKQGFLSNLCKFANVPLNGPMKLKALESVKTLLEIAYLQGDYLNEYWNHVVVCISRLEKLQSNDTQLLVETDERNDSQSTLDLSPEFAFQSLSVIIDKIFSSTLKLSVSAIVFFVKALCLTSWDEITQSSDKEHPRMYSLQKLVEISYYNMKRIRLEWSQIWAVMGPHLNQVGCHSNPTVGYFALDKMRQMAYKFLELEELPTFKFQNDFLMPFQMIFQNNGNVQIRDMVLSCIRQLLQGRSANLKSGWKVLLVTLDLAAQQSNFELIVLAFEIVKYAVELNLKYLVKNHCFPLLIKCLVSFCRNRNSSKIGLQAVDMFRVISPQLVNVVSWHQPIIRVGLEELTLGIKVHLKDNPLHLEDAQTRTWIPVLVGLYSIVMSEDLEIRSRALTFQFDLLKSHSSHFTPTFWKVCLETTVFPIFEELDGSDEHEELFATEEDWLVWVSTTLIQAFRSLVDLVSERFDEVLFIMDSILDLLIMALTQENESIARVGSTGLVELIERNWKRFDENAWAQVSGRLAYVLESTIPQSLIFNVDTEPGPEKSHFQEIILKCVLHLLVIQTIQDILVSPLNDDPLLFVKMHDDDVVRLLDGLEHSYNFAKAFNGNLPLRNALFHMGFMKQLPNLLKQETSSSFGYLLFLFKILKCDRQLGLEDRLFPLALDLLKSYNTLDVETRKRNVNAWRPVIVMILERFAEFSEDRFGKYIRSMYLPAVALLNHDLQADFRQPLRTILERASVTLNISS